MPRKRKLTDLGNRCRICLSSDACTSQLFVDCLRPKIQNLEKCSSIEILDRPNFPKKICYICLYKLEMWSEFKLQFLKTNQTLVSHFKIIEPQVNEASKAADTESAGDDLFARVDGKRPRVVVEELKSTGLSIDSNAKAPVTSTPLAATKASILKTADSNVEAVIINETENKVITVNKSHTSDSSSSPVRKISRAKKVERDALTKRWEERKNALLAATGELPSESESDGGTQMSPVQKARAKLNSSSDKDEEKSKKIQRALKNLQTNMTEKYTVSVENAIAVEERKTRSRRGNAETPASPTKSSKPLVNAQPKTDAPKEPVASQKKSNAKADMPLIEAGEEEVKKPEVVDKNVKVAAEKSSQPPVNDQPEPSQEDDDIEIIDVDDDTSNVNSVPAKEQPKEPTFTPQLVKSEVHLGNVTYVVTTTLGLPNTPSSKSDISLKTNGINIDATNQDGGKIDLLDSAHLQKIGTGDNSATKESITDASGSNIEKCLNIEIEGMEAEALQRVQLELAKFVNEDVPKRLLDESSTTSETDPKKLNFKDTYESLEYQLKNIVEKVLRRNYETDKNNVSASSKTKKKISPVLAKEAENSPAFQPEVNITKFNLGQLCKTYHINNLHILEEDKRQRGVVGPLSKTLGRKRTPKLPKKYDDYDLTMPVGSEVVRTATPTPKPAAVKRSSTPSSITQETPKVDKVDKVDEPKLDKIDEQNADDAVEPMNDSVNEPMVDGVDEPMADDSSGVENEPIPEEEPMEEDAPAENNTPTIITMDHDAQVEEVVTVEKKKETEKPVAKKPVDKKPIEKKPIEKKPIEKKPIEKPVEKKPVKENASPTSNAGAAQTSLQPILTMIKNAQPHVETILLVPTTPPTNAQVKVVDQKPKPSPTLPSLPSLANRQSLGNVSNKPSLKQILPSPTKTQPKPAATANSTPSKPMVKRQRHICGICGKELFSKEEAEAHVKSHKTDSLSIGSKPIKPILPKVTGPKPTIVTTTTVSMPATPEPQTQAQAQVQALLQAKAKPKPKLMRCKRCQAIVEAKEVRSHVCNSVKFNCTLCECSFGAEHLLLEHIETHARTAKVVKKTEVKTPQKPVAANKSGQDRVIIITGKNEAVHLTGQEDNADENQQSYSCFVCDKVFLEEDQMKEHLQMHCEEVGDESDAEAHQCAFCGEKFQSEEILEAHVGNHLKEDGDEKINMMINMETRRVAKPKKTTAPVFRCEQCHETFSSAYQLSVHLPIHDEESMAVDEEPEEDEHYVCNVCDEIFDSPDELAEHLNTEHNGNTHMCILCETSFSSVRELQEHVSTHL